MIAKKSLKVGKTYRFSSGFINVEGKVSKITANLVYFKFKDMRFESSGELCEKIDMIENILELKIPVDCFLYYVKSLNEPKMKVCSACGSNKFKTIYDHDCWGAPDGSRTFCDKCGCNKTKYI